LDKIKDFKGIGLSNKLLSLLLTAACKNYGILFIMIDISEITFLVKRLKNE